MPGPEDGYQMVLTDHAYFDSYLGRVDPSATYDEALEHISKLLRDGEEERWLDPFDQTVEHRICGDLHLVVRVDHETRTITVITVMIRGPTLWGLDGPWVDMLTGPALRKVMHGEW